MMMVVVTMVVMRTRVSVLFASVVPSTRWPLQHRGVIAVLIHDD
jgi:hypothetical protein